MSNLVVSNISDGTTSVGTEYVVNGSAKVTCSFYHSSGTPTVVGSMNVSSLTDNDTGTANVNYVSSMSSTAYVTACAGWAYSTWTGAVTATGAYATTNLLLSHRENGALVDATANTSPLSCVIAGDLA
jgi:hypothetical protein